MKLSTAVLVSTLVATVATAAPKRNCHNDARKRDYWVNEIGPGMGGVVSHKVVSPETTAPVAWVPRAFPTENADDTDDADDTAHEGHDHGTGTGNATDAGSGSSTSAASASAGPGTTAPATGTAPGPEERNSSAARGRLHIGAGVGVAVVCVSLGLFAF